MAADLQALTGTGQMTDGPELLRPACRRASEQSVEGLANRALNVLARRRTVGGMILSERHVLSLEKVVLIGDEEDRLGFITSLQAAGTSLDDILDYYVPAVARRLGVRWCQDSLGFADVTIGSARLQSMVRDLAVKLKMPAEIRGGSGVAVIVLADEYHTLGALILTSQLRRLGISVRLLLGFSDQDALREMGRDRYDAIMVSVSSVEALDNVRNFVEKIHRQTRRNTPVVIGGPALDNSTDVKAITGADVATCDVYEAVRACRLKTSHADAKAFSKRS